VKNLTRKEQIRLVAENMFRQKGYAATSMRHLAKAIGIEAASLYNHISSKEDLLKDICFESAAEFFNAINDVQKLELPPDEKLAAAIMAHVKVVTSNLNGSAVFLHEWRFLSEPHRSEYKKVRKAYRQEFRNILNEGVKKGYFKPVDTKLYSLSILSALHWIYDWYNPSGELSPEDLGRQFSYVLLEGVRKSSTK